MSLPPDAATVFLGLAIITLPAAILTYFALRRIICGRW